MHCYYSRNRFYRYAHFIHIYTCRTQCHSFNVWSTAILLWCLYDKVIPKYSPFDFSPWRSFFFFIYLFHEPWLHIICTYISRCLPEKLIFNVLTFILSQLIIIVLSLSIANLLDKYSPGFYALITGNRKK